MMYRSLSNNVISQVVDNAFDHLGSSGVNPYMYVSQGDGADRHFCFFPSDFN
jgi:hypothetical protein